MEKFQSLRIHSSPLTADFFYLQTHIHVCNIKYTINYLKIPYTEWLTVNGYSRTMQKSDYHEVMEA